MLSPEKLFCISIFLSYVLTIKADLKFCYNGRQHLKTTGFTNNSLHCPYGLLFREPVIIGAVESTNPSDSELFCFGNNICTLDSWKCTNKLQYAETQLIIPHKVLTHKVQPIPGDDKISSEVPICKYSAIDKDGHMENIIENKIRKKRQVSQISSNPMMEDKKKPFEKVDQSVIDDKTKRMFYYIAGVNIEDVSSHLRVTKLFHHAVRLVHMICDPLYLKEEFLDYVEDGFMFLLKQQGLERLTDVDSDDFALLQRALEYCMGDPDATVFVEGNHCPSDFYIESVRRKNESIPFDLSDEANYIWGKYDIVIDASWHIIDIVHGMCFATFKENLNLHHKFQVVMEQLFHDSLHLRWNSVTKFLREDRIDNVFTVSVNASMEVLDACAQGAYIKSPFLHRLQRPKLNTGSRKKRSLDETLPRDLPEMAYCLRSSEELIEKTQELQKQQCT